MSSFRIQPVTIFSAWILGLWIFEVPSLHQTVHLPQTVVTIQATVCPCLHWSMGKVISPLVSTGCRLWGRDLTELLDLKSTFVASGCSLLSPGIVHILDQVSQLVHSSVVPSWSWQMGTLYFVWHDMACLYALGLAMHGTAQCCAVWPASPFSFYLFFFLFKILLFSFFSFPYSLHLFITINLY